MRHPQTHAHHRGSECETTVGLQMALKSDGIEPNQAMYFRGADTGAERVDGS